MKGYINKQKYNECQLVAALNAAVFLGKTPILQDSQRYECLVDMARARYGSALRMNWVYEDLFLVEHHYSGKITFSWVKRIIEKGFPIEFAIYHPNVGYHSVLVIDAIGQDKFKTMIHPDLGAGIGSFGWNEVVRVLNFRQLTGKGTWIDWMTFEKHIPPRRVLNNLLIHRNVGGACRYFSAVGSTG